MRAQAETNLRYIALAHSGRSEPSERGRSLPKRVLYIVAIALVLTVGGAYILQPEKGVPEGAPTEEQMAAEIGAPVMEHIYRGHVEGRSG